MKLVIAEKPSVAMSLAAVLGATERKDGYLEGSGYLVSWCVGHLLELAQPEAYKEQYAKWRYEDLPILPENWKYEVPKDKKLMKDKRVDSVVCATDAGREGELIFRLVYEYAGCNKPMERLWISSMEDAAIREGFDHLRPGSDYDKLYDAAVCRKIRIRSDRCGENKRRQPGHQQHVREGRDRSREYREGKSSSGIPLLCDQQSPARQPDRKNDRDSDHQPAAAEGEAAAAERCLRDGGIHRRPVVPRHQQRGVQAYD